MDNNNQTKQPLSPTSQIKNLLSQFGQALAPITDQLKKNPLIYQSVTRFRTFWRRFGFATKLIAASLFLLFIIISGLGLGGTLSRTGWP